MENAESICIYTTITKMQPITRLCFQQAAGLSGEKLHSVNRYTVHEKLYYRLKRDIQTCDEVMIRLSRELQAMKYENIIIIKNFTDKKAEQRLKMGQEFYTTVCKDLKMCKERLQHFIR